MRCRGLELRPAAPSVGLAVADMRTKAVVEVLERLAISSGYVALEHSNGHDPRPGARGSRLVRALWVSAAQAAKSSGLTTSRRARAGGRDMGLGDGDLMRSGRMVDER